MHTMYFYSLAPLLMATVIHTNSPSQPQETFNGGFIVGILVGIVLLIIFFAYILPTLRDDDTVLPPSPLPMPSPTPLPTPTPMPSPTPAPTPAP